MKMYEGGQIGLMCCRFSLLRTVCFLSGLILSVLQLHILDSRENLKRMLLQGQVHSQDQICFFLDQVLCNVFLKIHTIHNVTRLQLLLKDYQYLVK